MTSSIAFGPSGPGLVQLSRRAITRLLRVPALIAPTIIMPAFFIVAFTGSFDGITRVDGYPTDNIVNWVAAFAIVQSASFAGIGAAGAMATDMDSGFLDRLLVSPVRRVLIVAGPLVQTAIRALIPVTVVLLIAALKGASMPGGLLGIVVVYAGAIGAALIMGCVGLAVVLHIGNIRAMAIVQIVAFVFLFPSTGQVPIVVMEGWLQTAARYNPATDLLLLVRQGFLGDVTWANTWPGLLVILGGVAIFGSWARYELGRLRD